MTELEKILSRLAHGPVRLIDYESSANYSHASVPTYDFKFTAAQDRIDDDDIPFCDVDCDHCDMCDEYAEEKEDLMMWGIPDVEYVIFNPPATIVFWEDGTKTVVKAMEGDRYEKYAGFAMACMKKMFGSTSRAKAIMSEFDEDHFKKFVNQKTKEKKDETPAE